MDTATHMLRTGRRGALFEYQMAFGTCALRSSGSTSPGRWPGTTSVSRYRGSILGPFWITLSMGLMVVGIGVLYANLFGVALHDFMPFVALGIVFFGSDQRRPSTRAARPSSRPPACCRRPACRCSPSSGARCSGT